MWLFLKFWSDYIKSTCGGEKMETTVLEQQQKKSEKKSTTDTSKWKKYK